MKFISFNINSLRIRLHQMRAIVDKYQPDFIGLQETKVKDENFPINEMRALGYEVEYFGQATHYGVALLSRRPFASVVKGFPDDDDVAQRRFIGGEFKLEDGSSLYVYNGYFPQGEKREHPTKFDNKRNFYRDLKSFLQSQHQAGDKVVVMGDMNVAPSDADVGLDEKEKARWLKAGKCSFLDEERDWLKEILDLNYIDPFDHAKSISRSSHGEEQRFSWFDYRNRGFERDPKIGLRIDLTLLSDALAKYPHTTGIDYDIRAMEKPSDHCPVWLSLDV